MSIFRKVPQIAIYQGNADIVVLDARAMAARAREECASRKYKEHSGAIHVFVGAVNTPEAQHVFRDIRWTLADARTTGQH